MFRNIAIICTGNICRSPIAEGLLRVRAGSRDLRIVSAGTYAMDGHPADRLACEVMADRGYDISAHRAQQATDSLLRAADLILVLDQSHREWIARALPQLTGRVHKLGKWRGDRDVADPYGQSKTAFERSFADIEAGIDDWLARI
jgi:protein-tyrosine phosphatase